MGRMMCSFDVPKIDEAGTLPDGGFTAILDRNSSFQRLNQICYDRFLLLEMIL
jgi:hypothetical protein